MRRSVEQVCPWGNRSVSSYIVSLLGEIFSVSGFKCCEYVCNPVWWIHVLSYVYCGVCVNYFTGICNSQCAVAVPKWHLHCLVDKISLPASFFQALECCPQGKVISWPVSWCLSLLTNVLALPATCFGTNITFQTATKNANCTAGHSLSHLQLVLYDKMPEDWFFCCNTGKIYLKVWYRTNWHSKMIFPIKYSTRMITLLQSIEDIFFLLQY